MGEMERRADDHRCAQQRTPRGGESLMTTGFRRLRTIAAFIALCSALWAADPASAAIEIHFWHAMSGHLNDAVDALAQRFNDRQREYEVKPLSKGTYPETLAAALAA